MVHFPIIEVSFHDVQQPTIKTFIAASTRKTNGTFETSMLASSHVVESATSQTARAIKLDMRFVSSMLAVISFGATVELPPMPNHICDTITHTTTPPHPTFFGPALCMMFFKPQLSSNLASCSVRHLKKGTGSAKDIRWSLRSDCNTGSAGDMT